ncbi:hypothetical protein ACJMK2_022263 [Sinanodonta woodiana]|uniref:CARD domain-containing protein n=1 Tax=Sinanodonta woodiana TaxID=1069815 RepID=A0ABD3TII5_SINWO
MAALDEVKDKKYTNWLSVNLALDYMKSGLHTFIKREFECLHQSLVQKIYGGTTASLPPCVMCCASRVKRDENGVWAFKKRCRSDCGVWLEELLAHHANPKSEEIYWNNSIVPSWPFQPWECAKVYMPRGQQFSNSGPAECDTQSLLMLLDKCTHFHPKLSPKGLSLTQTISAVRNKIMHDGEMKLSDADRINVIQQIIQLLEDPVHLKSLDDCKAAVSNIHKIDNVSLDADLEKTAWKAVVNEFRLELGIQEKTALDTVDTLKVEYKQLREHVRKRFEDYGANKLPIQEDVQSVKSQINNLEQQEKKHQDMSTTVISHEGNLSTDVEDLDTESQECKTGILTERRNRKRKAVEKEIAESGTPEKLHRSILNRCLPELVRNLDFKAVSMYIQQKEILDDVVMEDIMTENKLGTIKTLGYIPTTQASEAEKLLEKNGSIVIKGNPGEGKTTIALRLIDNEMYRERRVVVNSPGDWKTVDIDWVDIVVLEDILGKYDLDPIRLQEWMVYLPTIQEHVDAGKLQVIITTRTDILVKAYPKFWSLKLFSDHLSLTLSSQNLNQLEKMSILNRELKRNKKNMKEDVIEKCVTNFNGLIGFPQSCLLFAANSKLFKRGPEFFRSPNEFFFENIFNLEVEIFISLAFLFCHGKIYEEHLSPETMPKSSSDLFMDLAYHLQKSKEKADVTLLRDAYTNFDGMYIEKSISDEIVKGVSVKRSCIWFSHATVCEAVGQVLAKRSLEMVVKHGDTEYLYQRTYTAEAKVETSEKVFLPESMYSPLAERMVQDVIETSLVKSVVKHPVLKQNEFLMKLKDVLHKGNRIKDFFMANIYSNRKFKKLVSLESRLSRQRLSEGECLTFLQYVLQSDDSTVKLVFSHFMEFIVCTHNNNNSDCWQCNEKQNVLELALYYHFFELADNLITINACYTHVSLCNVARHHDLSRVQTILEDLKRSHVFDPDCTKAKKALCRAYLSGSQDVIEILLQEGITLDSMDLVHAVQHGDISVLMKVVEHLKFHNKWHQLWAYNHICSYYFNPGMYSSQIDYIPFVFKKDAGPTALYIAYCSEKFEMADYLLQNEAKISMDILPAVTEHSSKKAVDSLIQHLKVTCIWDPKCYDASQALVQAYRAQKYDVCDMLVQEGVLMTVKNLGCVLGTFKISLEAVKKALKYLKDTENWDPNCEDASRSLKEAFVRKNYDVCDLLIQEGVTITMKHVPYVISRSLDYMKTIVKQLKDSDRWDPKCDDASKALANACREEKYDVCDLLIQEGASLTMKNLLHVVSVFKIALEAVKKVVKHLKDTTNWDPKCEDASNALAFAYRSCNYDVFEFLIHEGVPLRMKNLPEVTVSLEVAKKAVQHLKNSNNWNPDCTDASSALDIAYMFHNYDVCDLLIQEGVSLTMKHVPDLVLRSLDFVKTIVKHLKDNGSWDPKCDDASKALANAYRKEKYDVCDLLIQEGVSLTMKHVSLVILRSLDFVKTIVKHLKDNGSWDPKCDDASEALAEAYREEKFDVCDLLIQDGVPLTMKTLQNVVNGLKISLESVKKAMQHLKDTNNWNPKCSVASKTLEKTFRGKKYNICNLLIQDGVSLTIKNLLHMVGRLEISSEVVKKAVQHLKDTTNWDPKCKYVSEALEEAYRTKNYDVCDLLIQEGVPITMKSIPHVTLRSLDYVKTVVNQLKDANSWDPMHDDATKALEAAYIQQKFDVCDLLIQSGFALTMKNLPHMVTGFKFSVETVKKAVQHLKDTYNWDPKCNDASTALENAYGVQRYEVCDLLIQEGVLLTMKNIPGVVYHVSLESVKKSIQHLDTHIACALLIHKAVNINVVRTFQMPLKTIKKAIEHLKENENWNAKSDEASEALANAYSAKMYDVCDMLLEETVSLTMETFPGVVGGFEVSCKAVIKAIEHLKATAMWDPKCEYASRALANAYRKEKYDVCDLLIQEGISLTMQSFDGVVEGFRVSLEAVKKALQHLKDTDNWVPSCEHASKVLENAYVVQKYDVCDLLIQEGVSLSMKNIPGVVYSVSLKYVMKVIQHMNIHDMFDLLVLKRVSPTLKNLPYVVGRSRVSLKAVSKVIHHLKETKNWDPKSEYASIALANASSARIYDVCDLLAQEGVLPDNEESSSNGAGNSLSVMKVCSPHALIIPCLCLEELTYWWCCMAEKNALRTKKEKERGKKTEAYIDFQTNMRVDQQTIRT